MTTPVARESSVHTNTGNYQCGTAGNIQATYTRGQNIDIKWGRNNHWGGFSAVSVLPMSRAGGGSANNADIIAAFNDPVNIIHTSCYNSNCQSPFGDKFGLGGDGTGFQETICSNSFKIPSYLPDGDYVMKWSVFGNGDSFGVRNMAHGNYMNCHNFRISGGQGVTAKPTGNAHIEFKLVDVGVNKFGGPQGQCMFSGGAVNPKTCKFIDGQRAPQCNGPVANLAKCGNPTADSRAECANGQEGGAQGGDLFNYMVGLPDYHPQYNGQYLLLSHNRANRNVAVAGVTPPGGGGVVTPPLEEEEVEVMEIHVLLMEIVQRPLTVVVMEKCAIKKMLIMQVVMQLILANQE